MQVIAFFQQLFTQLPSVVNFVITPLKDINVNLTGLGVISDLSIIQMFGIGVVGTITAFLVFHVIALLLDMVPVA